ARVAECICGKRPGDERREEYVRCVDAGGARSVVIMAINAIGGTNAALITPLLNLRSQLDELQAQLATGKKATTYAGIGVDRGFAIGLRTQINSIDSFTDTITNVNTLIQIANTTLSRISDIRSEVQHAASSPTLT